MPDTIQAPNAIDTALIKGNRGCQFLEIHRPSKQDLKTASEAFKEASEILKASLVLLDHDCYTVTEAPQAPGQPLFQPSGEPTKAASVMPEPEQVKPLPTLGIIDVEVVTDRKFKIGDRVKYLWLDEPEIGHVVGDDGCGEEEHPYEIQSESDPDGGLLYMRASDLEVVADDFTLPETIETEPFPKGNKAAQKKVFEERLATLEEIFCERLDLAGSTEPYGKQLKQFRPHRDAWIAAWKTDPKKAWSELLVAIATANVTAAEFSAWAPAA